MPIQVALRDFLRRAHWLPAAAALAAVVALAGAGTARADMVLGPGDTIRLSIHGLPNSEIQSIIGTDGVLTLAWPGAVDAADKTLEQVTEEVRDLAKGRVYKHYTYEGLLKIIQLDTNDISLDVVHYRPVFVTGDVARPGEVPFSPGISVRAAIAVSGGVRNSVLSGLTVADPAQIIRWQNEYDGAALDHATAVARLWRVNAEINGAKDPAPPGTEGVAVSASVFDALIAEQQQIVEVHLRSAEEDRNYMTSVVDQAHARVDILSEQQKNQAVLVAGDEEEQNRVQDLVKRNLVPATRLEESRRTLVLSRSRLLELESQLAQADQDVTRSGRDIEMLEERRLTQLYELREQLTATMIAARLNMEVLSQNLAGSERGEGSSVSLARTDAQVFVYRTEKGQVNRIATQFDTQLLPGDTVEVLMEQPVNPRFGQ